MSDLTGINRFNADIASFAEALDLEIETARKKVAFDLFAQVRGRTPVDTGRARANWDITAGAPSESIDEMPNLAKGAAIAPPAVPDLGETAGQPIYIINNLPYIEPLEHGHSTQAPVGIVEPAMEATAAHIDSIIAAGATFPGASVAEIVSIAGPPPKIPRPRVARGAKKGKRK